VLAPPQAVLCPGDYARVQCGQPRLLMETSPILRTLHVGVGRRGEWPLELCRPERGFQPVGLCDSVPEHLRAARARTGLGADECYTDFAAMLESVPADVLIICTPTPTHVPMARAAIARGLAVITEKGMATTWSEARALVADVAARSARVVVAQNYRYKAIERTVRRAIHDASAPFHVGRVFWVDYTEHRVRPEPRTLTYPFASVWDMSCHHFDNLTDWLGRPRAVTARAPAATWSAYPHPANTAAFIEFADDVHVNYAHTQDAARIELRIRVHGERGALFVDDTRISFSSHPRENFGWIEPTFITAEPAHKPPEAGILADFHRYLTTGDEPGISARHNLEVMALCELTVRSCQQARRVTREELNDA
jgi:predicted dehydrogenase